MLQHLALFDFDGTITTDDSLIKFIRFVATKMTEGMDLPEKLTAQPQQVAEDICNAQQKGKNVLYTKWVWRYVMMIIKAIPEFMFKKMSI